jgi:hypothetical protein
MMMMMMMIIEEYTHTHTLQTAQSHHRS